MSIRPISSGKAIKINTNQSKNEIANMKSDISNNILKEVNDKLNNKHTDNKDKLREIVEKINEFIKPNNTSLKFQLHEELKEYYVSVIDEDTQEIVREIPSKKLLDIYAAMTEFVGMVIDKKI